MVWYKNYSRHIGNIRLYIVWYGMVWYGIRIIVVV